MAALTLRIPQPRANVTPPNMAKSTQSEKPATTVPTIPHGPTTIGHVGRPGGSPPANPKDGQEFQGPGGVWWRYSVGQGGWVRIPVSSGTVTTQSRPSQTPGTPTPSALSAPAPPPPPAPPAPAPSPPSFDYANAFLADPRYAPGLAGITTRQLGIGQAYGLTINRDTTQGSPTYGMAYYRKPQLDANGKPVKDANGNPVYESRQITARIDPATGAYTYTDPSGKTYNVSDLELDVVPIARGQAGYLEGSLGQATEQSAVRQQQIGESAAQAGVGKSGMRAQASLGEVAALYAALSGLTRSAAGEFAGTTQSYADLLGRIYPDLAARAAALASAPSGETPPSEPAPTPAPNIIPGGDFGTDVTVGPDNTLSAGPDGEFMKLMNNIIGASQGHGGTGYQAVVWALNNVKKNYKLSSLQIDWIDRWIRGHKPAGPGSVNIVPNTSGGGGGGGGQPTGGGGGGGAGGGTTPWWDTMGSNTVGGSIMPGPSRGAFDTKGSPQGSNKPKNPSPGTVFKGETGVVWVYRENGPGGEGWYKRG